MKPLHESVRRSLEEATQIFEAALPGSPAEEYLVGRGIARGFGFRLGYVAEAIPGFERFTGRLCIPNICAAGHVVGIKFRALGDGEPKYDKPAGMSNRLFNLRALNEDSPIIALCEGEVDAISVAQLGIPAVGVQGANGWKAHHPMLFEGYERVAVVRDMDEKGLDLAKKILATDLPVVVVEPPGDDANDAVQLGNGVILAKLIRGE